jgi:hypothetical protein
VGARRPVPTVVYRSVGGFADAARARVRVIEALVQPPFNLKGRPLHGAALPQPPPDEGAPGVTSAEIRDARKSYTKP